MNGTEKKEQRPLILEFNEAKMEIAESINKAIRRGIPCFMLQDMINNLANQINSAAAQELASAKDSEQKAQENEPEKEGE